VTRDPAPASLAATFLQPRVLVMASLGVASGLPYAVANETGTLLLADLKVDRTAIGAIGAISGIYAFKFLWSPLVDARAVPGLARLGLRRSWLLATQLPMVAIIAMLAGLAPAGADASTFSFGVALAALAVLSATQDIAVNAWTVDAFPRRELGIGSAATVAGYRLALLAGGSLAPLVAAWLGWNAAFLVLAAIMAIGPITTLVAREPRREPTVHPPPAGLRALLAPIRELLAFAGPHAVAITLFVLLFRLPDQLGNAMQKPFLLEGLGYTKEQYGLIRNALGIGATLVGAAVGGGLVARFGLVRALVLCGLAQAASNLGFVVLSLRGPAVGGSLAWGDPAMLWLGAVSLVESLAGGMVATAFVAWLMSLCDRRYAATQYAVLTGLFAIGQSLASVVSGPLSKELGWIGFYLATVAVAVPGLALIRPGVRAVRPDAG
jgi:PAT family beta-lactamase induction signal transducer AmpG